MNVNTLARLMAWAREHLSGERLLGIRGVGETLLVEYWDGRIGCLAIDTDGVPILMEPAAD